ncbi:MAG: hypothetical protein Q4G42_08760 [Neisseria sp.]|nr:hypothetical protein [Neisseria sp.]
MNRSSVASLSALRHWLWLVLSLLLLAGCTNPVKTDLQALEQTFKTGSFSPENTARINRQMATAHSDADRRAALQEMVTALSTFRDQLRALPLKSEQVKTLRDKMATASDNMAAGMREALTLGANNQDFAAQQRIQQKIIDAQQLMSEASIELKRLTVEHKLENSAQ